LPFAFTNTCSAIVIHTQTYADQKQVVLRAVRNVDYSPTKTGYGSVSCAATATAAAAYPSALASRPAPPPPLFLEQIVRLILDTKVQVVSLLEVGVVQAARDAYNASHGLVGNDDDDDSDDGSDGYHSDDSISGGGGSAAASGYDVSLVDASVDGIAQLAYLLLAEGYAAHKVPTVLRPGYLVQICDPLLRVLLAHDAGTESVGTLVVIEVDVVYTKSRGIGS